MKKLIHHVVRRPGKNLGDRDIEIPVAEELASTPGIPLREQDVSFYSRVYPLENPDLEKAADIDWEWAVLTEEVADYRKGHNERSKPHLRAAGVSGDLEPTGTPEPGKDVAEKLRRKARELGFGEVGFTKFDHHYAYAGRKAWVKYEHAICLAPEQDYNQTQTIPSLEGEHAHYGTYETEAEMVEDLTDYIRSLGYHAQMHIDGADSAAYIPMFVSAGLGQLGANGQLLSPHFGSRARLAIVTTDAPVTYDGPVDYGISKFCQICQVCVDRCPGRALIKDKVWWRGAQKNKVIYERCRPVMARYEGCGVCMKVCPIQKYGMKPVMEHYVDTGTVLGKGTDNLEGYALRDRGYFESGRLPVFSREFFEIPNSRPEQLVFEQFKERLKDEGIPSPEELTDFAAKVKDGLDRGKSFYDHDG